MNKLFERQSTPDGGGDGGAGGGAGGEKPDWLLPKFQSSEEQARAYAEAEKRMAQLQSQLDQERQQFTETISSIQQQQPEPPQTPLTQDPIIQHYTKAVEEGDAQAMLAINLELQRRQFEQILEEKLETKMKPVTEAVGQVTQTERENAIMLATERVKGDYGDNWDLLAPKIGAVLQERPHWIPQGASVEAFATTLREVADLVISQEQTVQRQKDDADRIAKLSAQGLSGSGSRALSPQEQADEWNRIKKTDLGGYAGILRG